MVYATGGRLIPYDKLVPATINLLKTPPIGGLHSDDGVLINFILGSGIIVGITTAHV